MIFDQPPAELPAATLRPRDWGGQLLLDARRWLAARWSWLRPRWIPVLVAFAGMLAVLASARYLRDLASQPPEQLPAPVLTVSRPAEPVMRVRAADGLPAGALAPRPCAPEPAEASGGEGTPMKLDTGARRLPDGPRLYKGSTTY